MKKIFRKKPIRDLLHKEGRLQLAKTLGPFDLILLGVGAIVGTGIFILPGTVSAQHAGPGIVFSFVVAAIVCALAGMCYSEFASTVPVTGSAYSYSYIVFGEIIAWIVGWALLLEYGLATAAVATGWSGYFVSLLDGFNIHLPLALTGAFSPENGTYINLPAILIIFTMGYLLMFGMKESARFNTVMVAIKISVVLLFIIVGVFYVKPENWSPFLPFGVSGVFSGAALVFFAYLGFDAVSSAAEEVKNPQRNMPIGIIGSLVICTILYILVSLVLTGIVPYTQLNVADPVAFAMQVINQGWIAGIISLGAVVGMMTVILVMMYGGTRLLLAFARDGLMPKTMSEISPKRKTPVKNTAIFTLIISIIAGFIPLDTLAEMVNMGTLIAFVFVSAGIIYLRKNKELPEGGFKVPLYPLLPILSLLLCIFLISQLSLNTWIACGVWFVIGLIIYFTYGKKHSTLN
ncbi:amino acid permease [Lysinibacillus sp. 2017]|uniref:amino acid permease n=1 Tax=unclassified Lysinibacillus TaxID=2636778 RepID=UPI000D526357|nr:MULTISPECIES: amino acid permease [unclassified Lysinibacillus]AWE08273.1 amino acid permease [Lysinibacillus sp. 2017]TGN36224.1 amino acid permease [Lysinibacillus sp. S2017]